MPTPLDALREENAILRERVALLEREIFGTDLVFPQEWMLTPSKQRIVGVLVRRPLARRDLLLSAIYVDRDEANPKIVDVMLCKIRQKLAPFAVTIRTVWGVGYVIDEPQRSELRRRIDPTFEGSTADPGDLKAPARAQAAVA